VTGVFKIEWFYSDMYQCEDCISRFSILLDENARLLLLSEIKKTANITGKNI
jgi:hypothetical protein